jgi:hypothetical protein
MLRVCVPGFSVLPRFLAWKKIKNEQKSNDQTIKLK